jgi:hypothetical protein
MSLYSKIELFTFADYYHRLATTGLTMEEIFLHWQKHSEKPRDLDELAKLPRKLKQQLAEVKPPAIKLQEMANVASVIHGVNRAHLDIKSSKRDLAQVRQQVCYAAIEYGFEPIDIHKILGWDRTLTYARAKKAKILAETVPEFRETLQELLARFGLEEFID